MISGKKSPKKDSLAITRTIMASERTLLSYIRTGMAFAISGAGVLKFVEDGNLVLFGGWALIGIGGVFVGWGWYSFRKIKRDLLK